MKAIHKDINSSVERFENYINNEEISQRRTSNEYILWFEEKLRITKEYRKEFKTQNILHQGVAKIFYEELFPLYRLLQNKLEEWKDVQFKPIIGNQNHDVKVKSNINDVPQHIEITVADQDKIEHARMEYFLNHGYVNAIGEVLIERDKKSGKKITVQEEARPSKEINQKIKNRISELINKKMVVKERPNNTALLVFFDDYIAFRYDKSSSKSEMNTFLDSINTEWQNRYSALYVVGASESFYERCKSIKNLQN